MSRKIEPTVNLYHRGILMQGPGYKSFRKPTRRELRNPIISNTRKSLISRMEGQRKEIVLLEPGCWIHQDLEPWWVNLTAEWLVPWRIWNHWRANHLMQRQEKIFDCSVFQDSNLLLVFLVSWNKMAANCCLVWLQPARLGSCII